MRAQMSTNTVVYAVILGVLCAGPAAFGHCQIPCGIYDDQMRFDMLSEHITTIEKSRKAIIELSAQSKSDMNQLIRWVQNKDYHADQFSDIVTYYFMSQRIKLPAENNAEARHEYLDKLSVLHEMLIYAMKTKQTTDAANVEKLRVLLDKFRGLYFNEAEHEHSYGADVGAERKGSIMDKHKQVTMKGKTVTLVGKQVNIGELAPDAEVIANDMSPVKLSAFRGKVLIISSVPSLDTSVCDTETRRFNEESQRLGDNVAVLTISMDLPFAQKRWCGAAGIKNVRTLSDYRAAAFGETYGVLIDELRLLARAVFVVDRQGIVRYIQIVEEIAHEPDYEAVLKVVKELTS